MSEVLKTCPSCSAGDDKVQMWDNTSDIVWKHAYQVFCCECGTRTLYYRHKEEAIEEWNNYERADDDK